MRVLLVSLFPPSRHNLFGPSALPYYLAKYKPAHVQLDLVYYERAAAPSGEDAGELTAIFSAIRSVRQQSRWSVAGLKVLQQLNLAPDLKGLYLRFLPKRKDLRRIREQQYDIIWLYPNVLFPWYKDLGCNKVLMTGPDCSLLHYQLLQRYLAADKDLFPVNLPQVRSFKQYFDRAAALEKAWAGSTALLHVVGQEDKKAYDGISNRSHCFFSPHPVSEYTARRGRIADAEGKLTILISGVNNGIYIGNLLDRLTEPLLSAGLAGMYRFLIVGGNFERLVERLTKAGYEVEYSKWVEDYATTIARAHIQLFPIALGTGTKGKVLSAMATGLLCIGTKHAFENILIDVSTDCLLLSTELDLKGFLEEIHQKKEHYSEMADRAMQKVRFHHSPEATSASFWDHVLKELQ